MSGREVENGWAIHSTLNQTKEKYRQLGASLLLTSSFVHHRHHLSRQKKQRLEQQANTHENYHQQVLQAKRINDARPTQAISNPLSSIDELKTHARKLMDEHTIKLGKENQPQECPIQDVPIATIESQQLETRSSFRVIKKPNKRRIVKGRPEMYAVTRRRAVLQNILQERSQGNPKGVIHQLLNKNNLLKFISTHNDKAETGNLYDNFQRYSALQEPLLPMKRTQTDRKSLINMKAGSVGKGRRQESNQQWQYGNNEGVKGCGWLGKKRRYSSIKTIE